MDSVICKHGCGLKPDKPNKMKLCNVFLDVSHVSHMPVQYGKVKNGRLLSSNTDHIYHIQ